MSNILTQNWLISRRHLLRGIGATIALPLLDCMRPLRALAAAVEKPKRSVFVYIPNGVNVLTWQITKASSSRTMRRGFSVAAIEVAQRTYAWAISAN